MVVDNNAEVTKRDDVTSPWQARPVRVVGFPELWVDVPDTQFPSRPAGLRPGLTIHLLEEPGFRTAPTSHLSRLDGR